MNYMFYNIIFFLSRGDVVLQHHSQEKKKFSNGFLSDILM